MTPEEASQFVCDRFPFEGEGYGETAKAAYVNIAKTVLLYLQRDSTILDFGSGPCDRTAVLQMLGYRCSAVDDLQDPWHGVDGNRELIFAFVKEFGIDFVLTSDDTLPFQKSSFDMLMMHDILEHLHDSPRDLLNNLLEFVKPQGFFFATVPNAVNIRKRIHVLIGKTNLSAFESYYWHPNPYRDHVREYVKGDLIALCDYCNLEIVELKSFHQMLQKVPAFARPVYRAMTRIFTGWRDSWLLVAKKKPDWLPVKRLPQGKFENIMGPAYVRRVRKDWVPTNQSEPRMGGRSIPHP